MLLLPVAFGYYSSTQQRGLCSTRDPFWQGGKTVAKTKQPLDAGETFPSYEVAMVDGRSVRIPDQLDKEYNVLLIYRGSW